MTQRQLDAINAAAKELAAEISTLRVKLNRITRQRDEARGRAAEYRATMTRYQRELAQERSRNRHA